MAAVRVVLPWSTCPIVPMLRCGLVRTYCCLVMGFPCTGIRMRETGRSASTLPRRFRVQDGEVGEGSASSAAEFGGKPCRTGARQEQACERRAIGHGEHAGKGDTA